MKFDKTFGLLCIFASILVVFSCISGILHGNSEIARNTVWALGYTLLYGIRDELQPAAKRIFNLVLFSAFTMLAAWMLLLQDLDTKAMIAIGVALIYTLYRLHEAYTLKIE